MNGSTNLKGYSLENSKVVLYETIIIKNSTYSLCCKNNTNIQICSLKAKWNRIWLKFSYPLVNRLDQIFGYFIEYTFVSID
jgi:hypothetical protein